MESHRPRTWRRRALDVEGGFRGANDAGSIPGPADESDVLESLLCEAGLLLQVSEVHLEAHLLVQGMLQVVRAHLQDLHSSKRALHTRTGELGARQ